MSYYNIRTDNRYKQKQTFSSVPSSYEYFFLFDYLFRCKTHSFLELSLYQNEVHELLMFYTFRFFTFLNALRIFSIKNLENPFYFLIKVGRFLLDYLCNQFFKSNLASLTQSKTKSLAVKTSLKFFYGPGILLV